MKNIRKLLTTLIIFMGIFSTTAFANQDLDAFLGYIDSTVSAYENINGQNMLVVNVVLKENENNFINLVFAGEFSPLGASLNGAVGKSALFAFHASDIIDKNSNTYFFNNKDSFFVLTDPVNKDSKKIQEIKASLLNKHLTA